MRSELAGGQGRLRKMWSTGKWCELICVIKRTPWLWWGVETTMEARRPVSEEASRDGILDHQLQWSPADRAGRVEMKGVLQEGQHTPCGMCVWECVWGGRGGWASRMTIVLSSFYWGWGTAAGDKSFWKLSQADRKAARLKTVWRPPIHLSRFSHF